MSATSHRSGKLLVSGLILILLMALACAAQASADVSAPKTDYKIGEKIVVTYDYSHLEQFTHLEYTWTAFGDEDSTCFREVKRGKLTKPKGKVTYKVTKDDGVGMQLVLQPYSDYVAIGYNMLNFNITNGKTLAPLSVKITQSGGELWIGDSYKEITIKLSGGYGELSNVWVAFRNSSSDSWYYCNCNFNYEKNQGTVILPLIEAEKPTLRVEAWDTHWNCSLTCESTLKPKFIRLKKSGWVKKGGKTYYGDKNKYAVRGYQTIDGSHYFFDDQGVLCTGWNKITGSSGTPDGWYYSDSDGKILTNFSSPSSITIPAKVDGLNLYMFGGISRGFIIYCDPGSYAEECAKKWGIEYDNGQVHATGGTAIASVAEKVRWIVKYYTSSSMTERQKVRALHNWLIYNAYYDQTYTIHSADGVLLQGTGVCESYARAFQELAAQSGLESKLIFGTAKNSSSSSYESHAWNLVKVDGSWYHIDCTWDDPIRVGATPTIISTSERDEYFLVTDSFISRNHRWSSDIKTPTVEPTGPVGWYQADGYWYYYKKVEGSEEGQLVTGELLKIDGKLYGFDDSGRLGNGWITASGKYYYTNAKGYPYKNKWISSGGYYYYFGKNYAMQTGWLKLKEGKKTRTYYLTDSGAMATGWATVNGSFYYFNPSSGYMETGWVASGGSWYYLNTKTGKMVTGWQTIKSSWYFFSADGSMHTGWLQSGSSWYYMDSSGAMVTGRQVIDGVVQLFDDNGVWLGPE